ncbi:MAG TPA: LuxR C-terminal-related transcriptional regulator [bacterium]|nr:LuxR C-terminal-related transcriptional regulator [bacterium]
MVRRRPRPVRRASSVVSPPPKRLHNLPTQLTTFIGREQEIVEVKCLLATTRLLTLTGAGGCGKTRFALQVAGLVVEQHRDGVWLAELASITDPAFVPKTVASALEVPEQPRRAIADTLIDALRSKALLLVLDNCEHLLAACVELVVPLLRECPEVHILTTSREGLGIPGEVLRPVPSLSMPERTSHLRSTEDLLAYDAVRLFVERAAATAPGFEVTSENAPAVAHVCQRLDGIPLAIELAAARVKVLAVRQIAARLDDRFRLLVGADRTAVPRHQTLRATMDWSYDLLPERERAVLRRLSVFPSGWGLDAAEAICSGNDLEASDILDLLTRLVDKSLVVAETQDGEARYRLLETVRQYCRDRLSESNEAAIVQVKHRDWYLQLAERGERELRGNAQVAWLERLETEHDNLRAALAWSKADAGEGEAWLRLAAALREFWHMRGYLSEGREWLEAALSADHSASETARAKALSGAGLLAYRQGDPRGEVFLEQSLVLFRKLRDQWGIAYALHHIAHCARNTRGLEAAERLLEESVAIFKEIGNRWGVGWSLHCLAELTLDKGDDRRAALMLEESLALCRAAGNIWTTSFVLGCLGLLAERQGYYDRATALLEESVALAQQIRAKYATPQLQAKLAHVALSQGYSERAFTLYRESLLGLAEIGAQMGAARPLEGLAAVAIAQGRFEQAARLLGAVEAVGETLVWSDPPLRTDHDSNVAATRAALGKESFAVAWAQGRTMTLEQAIEYALAATEGPPRERGQGVERLARRRASLLAPRERVVAALIVEGKSNREIAATLSIRESTAESHVQHILNKLGFNSRTQIAAWAVSHGLHPAS